MKSTLQKICIAFALFLGFIFGIYVILTADTGNFSTNVPAAIVSGVLISVFFGINETIFVYKTIDGN